VKTKISPQAKIPKKWEDFHKDSQNKVELFSFLTERGTNISVPESKTVFITSGMCNTCISITFTEY